MTGKLMKGSKFIGNETARFTLWIFGCVLFFFSFFHNKEKKAKLNKQTNKTHESLTPLMNLRNVFSPRSNILPESWPEYGDQWNFEGENDRLCVCKREWGCPWPLQLSASNSCLLHRCCSSFDRWVSLCGVFIVCFTCPFRGYIARLLHAHRALHFSPARALVIMTALIILMWFWRTDWRQYLNSGRRGDR